MAGVHGADAAILRAALGVLFGGVQQAAVVAELPLLHFQVELSVREYDVPEVTVFRARLGHDHTAVFFEDCCVDEAGALRTEGASRLRQAGLKRLDGSAGIRSFGL
jgi:hypothetical protein